MATPTLRERTRNAIRALRPGKSDDAPWRGPGPKPIPRPELKQPDKPRIDIDPGDLLEAIPPPKMEDQKLYEFVVHESFKNARDARYFWELEWALSLEFYVGNQWYGLNQTTRDILDFYAQDVSGQRLATLNGIGWRIDAVASLASQSAPEPIAEPLTNSDKDRQAATEGRGVINHYNQKFKIKSLIREAVNWSLQHTCPFAKITMEPGLDVDVMGDDGNVTTAPLGDIDTRIIPGARVYLDPSALKFEQCRWLIHAELCPLSWFADNFENGKFVTADPGGGVVNYANRQNQFGIAAGFGFGSIQIGRADKLVNKHVATYYEMWIKPGIISSFPYGAVIKCAGGQVLVARKGAKPEGAAKPTTHERAWGRAFGADSENERHAAGVKKRIPGKYVPWPYDCTTEFPFVPLPFKANPNSPYSFNLVRAGISVQQEINRIETRQREWLEAMKAFVYTPSLSGKGSDRLKDMPLLHEVPYDSVKGGGPPTVIQLPPPPGNYDEKLVELAKYLDDVYGIHDPNSRGQTETDVTSGVAIQGLKQADASRLAEFGNNIENFVEGVGTWWIRHVSQYYGHDRLMALSDTGSPSRPVTVGPDGFPVRDPARIHPPMRALAAGMAMAPPGPQGSPPMGAPVPGGPMPPPNAGGTGNAPPPSDPSQDPTLNPAANVLSFQALTSGGRCQIKVQEGSALADTPASQEQKYTEWYEKGLFGPIGSPSALKIFWSLVQSADSDVVIQRVDEMQERLDAEAALSMPPPPPSPIDIAQAQATLQRQTYAASVDADTQSQIAIIKAKAQYPAATIQFKGDSAGTLSVEEDMGLDVHGAATHMALVANAGPVGADIHHHYMPGQPAPVNQPDPTEQAMQQATIAQSTAEHGAGLDVQKQAATQAMTPQEPTPPQPDPDADLARQKDLASHESKLKIAEMEAQARLTPKQPAGGGK